MGINPYDVIKHIAKHSIALAVSENNLQELIDQLRNIVPDISDQYSSGQEDYNDYLELKMRAQQAFQCKLMLLALRSAKRETITVIDIGDSAGTHMLYLKALAEDKFQINTVSINLDPIAVDKIKAKGLQALQCRAEDVNFEGNRIDLFTSFEMVEHLHNPAIFFYKLTKKTSCKRMVVTVPYLRKSRVGLHHVRTNSEDPANAENEHIFELSPEDWTLLMFHSGWKVVHREVYLQYPRRYPILSQLFSWYWRETDFEGFWGVILEKDTTYSDCYQDWEV